MTLSSEKTISKIAISLTTTKKFACDFPPSLLSSSSPATLECISRVDLTSKNKPPSISTRSRPLILNAAIVKSGFVSFIIQNNERRSSILVIIASPRPTILPLPLCSGGSLPTKIAINMMLSMPKTISKPVSVSSDIHASGELNHSNIYFLC